MDNIGCPRRTANFCETISSLNKAFAAVVQKYLVGTVFICNYPPVTWKCRFCRPINGRRVSQSSVQRRDYHYTLNVQFNKSNIVTSSLKHTTLREQTQDDVAGLYHYPPVSGGCSSSLFLRRGLQTADLSSMWVGRAPAL